MRGREREISEPRLGSEVGALAPLSKVFQELRGERRGRVKAVRLDWEVGRTDGYGLS